MARHLYGLSNTKMVSKYFETFWELKFPGNLALIQRCCWRSVVAVTTLVYLRKTFLEHLKILEYFRYQRTDI